MILLQKQAVAININVFVMAMILYDEKQMLCYI